MKKWVCLLLACTMSLALIACGSNTSASENEAVLTKEELLGEAKDADANDINNEAFDNLVKVKSNYCNQTLRLKGQIKQFGDNYVELVGYYGATYVIDVYLPVEEMLELESGQSIVVVGQTTDEIKEETTNVGGYSFDYKHFQMPLAYLVEDRVEVEGVLKGANTSYVPAFNIEIGSSNVLKLIYFNENVDISSLEWNQKIKFSAKAISKNDSWCYYDAEIIE